MKSSSSLGSMPHDILSNIVRQLPAVNKSAPYRDLLNLGATCKGLRTWTNSFSSSWRKQHWPALPKGSDWPAQLESILALHPDPDQRQEKRLFREPMLRALTKAAGPEMGDHLSESNKDFWLHLHSEREFNPPGLAKILYCLKNFKDFSSEEKRAGLAGLADLVSSLGKDAQLRALTFIFAALVSEIPALPTTETTLLLRQIILLGEQGLVDKAHAAQFALKMQFSTGRRFRLLDKDLVTALKNLPEADRFRWIQTHVPGIFESRTGIQCMASSRLGCTELAVYFKNKYSGKATTDKVDYFAKLCLAEHQLRKFREGVELLGTASHIFLQGEFIVDHTHGGLGGDYLTGLRLYIRDCHKFFDKKQRDLLAQKVGECVSYLIDSECFDQSTALMFEANQAKLNLSVTSFWDSSGFMSSLEHAAMKLKSIPDQRNRYAMWNTLVSWRSAVSFTGRSSAKKQVKLVLADAIKYLPQDVQEKAKKRLGM